MNFLKREIISINAAAFLIGAAGFLSRLLGLFRDRLLASHFGASRTLDIYYAAFQIPDFIFTVFLVGSATAAIIPIFLEYAERDRAEAGKLIESLFTVFLLISAGFCGLIILFAPLIVRYLTPGFSAADQQLTVYMTRIMMASPFCLSLSNIVSGVIQANRRFVTFSLSPIFYNIGIIVGIVFLLPVFGLTGLAWGVVLGAVLHFLVQMPAFYSMGFGLRPSLALHPGMKRIIALSIPRVLAISFTSATGLFLTALGSTLTPGSISVMQFARNIQFIPVGIFGVSFAVAVFPRLSESFIKKNADDFYSAFFGTLATVFFWLAPVSVLFFVLRAHIIRLALGAGHFSWHDTRVTAAVLGFFCITIITESINPLFIKSFYAVNKTARPLVINIISAVFIIGLSFILVPFFSNSSGYLPGLLGEILKVDDIRDLGVLGIACAVVIGQVSDFILLFRFFMAEARRTFGFVPETDFWHEVMTIILTAFAAGIVTYGALRVLNYAVSLDTFHGVLIQGGGAGLIGVATYGLILYSLKNRELMNFIEVFRRRMLKTQVLPQGLDTDLESPARD